MDIGHPINDVVPGPRGAVLAVLARLTEPRTGRQIARESAQASSTTARILDDLTDAGLVIRVMGGRDHTYQLNREHVAATAIVELASLRGTLLQRVRALISGRPEVIAGWLFGSAARGDGTRDSDIDIALVAEDGKDVVAAADDVARAVFSWTGNPVQIVEHNRSSLAALVKESNPLVAALQADGIELVAASSTLLSVRRG